jgi:tetratricopeptide (TPR) repeat protein
VVHRDIKPGNVLFGADGALRVTDFGTAARTGSTLALADGSPFSASPQQLAGKAATTSDDVYGLGALAYELLSRYPPYYPEFDAARAQHEMPAPLASAHPAPPELLAFVMSMLERDAHRRPDLRQVIDFFAQCLQPESGLRDSGAAMVVPESQPQTQPQTPRVDAPRPGRGMRFAAVGLIAAAVAAVLLFALMPAPSSRQKPAAPVPAAMAPAVQAVAEPAPAAPVTQGALPPTVEQELAAGAAAIAASQPAVARAAYERVLLREPGNAAARAGIAATQKLSRLLDVYTEAMRAETARDIGAAKARYAAALELQSDFAPAQAGMARVQEVLRLQAFESALAQGAAALAAGRIDAAEAQYLKAATLGGVDARVKDGQERIAEIRRSERNTRDMARGADLESQEKWSEALEHYREVAARDDSLRFAADGLARSLRRVELDRELQDYLDRPERLIAPAVRAAANRALARGEATTAPAARLGAQLRELRTRLDALTVKVRVQISSDNSTSVSVAPVGDLGAFTEREVLLPPGQYAIIGRREGYRDVRRELNIAPGQQQASVAVQCTEKI